MITDYLFLKRDWIQGKSCVYYHQQEQRLTFNYFKIIQKSLRNKVSIGKGNNILKFNSIFI